MNSDIKQLYILQAHARSVLTPEYFLNLLCRSCAELLALLFKNLQRVTVVCASVDIQIFLGSKRIYWSRFTFVASSSLFEMYHILLKRFFCISSCPTHLYVISSKRYICEYFLTGIPPLQECKSRTLPLFHIKVRPSGIL